MTVVEHVIEYTTGHDEIHLNPPMRTRQYWLEVQYEVPTTHPLGKDSRVDFTLPVWFREGAEIELAKSIVSKLLPPGAQKVSVSLHRVKAAHLRGFGSLLVNGDLVWAENFHDRS